MTTAEERAQWAHGLASHTAKTGFRVVDGIYVSLTCPLCGEWVKAIAPPGLRAAHRLQRAQDRLYGHLVDNECGGRPRD